MNGPRCRGRGRASVDTIDAVYVWSLGYTYGLEAMYGLHALYGSRLSVLGLEAMHGVAAMHGLEAWKARGWNQKVPCRPHVSACRSDVCDAAAILSYLCFYLCRIAPLTGLVCLLVGRAGKSSTWATPNGGNLWLVCWLVG